MDFLEYLNWLDAHRSTFASPPNEELPPHPGKILEEDYLKKHGFTQTELSRRLGCTHAKVNEVIRGKRGVTPEFALDLEQVTQIKAETWMRIQLYHDLYLARAKR